MDLVKIRKKARKDRASASAPPTEPPVSPSGPGPETPPPPPRSSDARQIPAAGFPEEGSAALGTGALVSPQPAPPLVPAPEGDLIQLAGEELYKQGYLQTDTDNRLELLCFKLSEEDYAFPIAEVREIIMLRTITEVPRVPSFVLGVISLRGVIVPIFDLRTRLGLPPVEPTRAARIVIATDDLKTLGMVVDRVTNVVRIPQGSLEPPPPVLGGIEGEFIQGVGRDDHRMIILLNLKRILDLEITPTDGVRGGDGA